MFFILFCIVFLEKFNSTYPSDDDVQFPFNWQKLNYIFYMKIISNKL